MVGFFHCPPFSAEAPRYDMETYVGRLWHFYRTINPALLLETPASLRRHEEKLALFKRAQLDRSRPENSDASLWYSRSAIEGCVHPTTKDVIPAPARMAAFVPSNFLIAPVMVMPSTIASTLRTIGIHWVNQSYNCAVNYANRSSDALDTSTLLQAYAAAVAVSCTGALGATFLLRRVADTASARATAVRATLPFAAVAFSGGANVAMMRRGEWLSKGVAVRDANDPQGDAVGYSKAAGRAGVAKCAAARFLWNIPPLALPPLIMMRLGRTAWMKRMRPGGVRWTEVGVVCAMMVCGVAPALAAFKPYDLIAAGSLEPEFHTAVGKDGAPIRMYVYYKGL